MFHPADLPTPTVTAERTRLRENLPQFGNASGGSLGCLLAFGLPFVGIGVFCLLLATGQVPVDNAPRGDDAWMAGGAGVIFVLGGLMIWGMAWRGWRAQAYRERARREHPHEPALHDHPWDPGGETFNTWAPVRKGFFIAGFITLFLAPFNYWAFFTEDSNFFLKVIIGLTDLIVVAVWWHAFHKLAQALRFRPGRVVFHEFPYRPGAPLVLSWEPGSRLDDATRATAVLRCFHEYWETKRSGNKTTKSMVHEQLWAESYELPPTFLPKPHTPLELAFHPPADAPGTCLGGETVYVWQLVVRVQRPGVDLEELFLVPVYAP